MCVEGELENSVTLAQVKVEAAGDAKSLTFEVGKGDYSYASFPPNAALKNRCYTQGDVRHQQF